MTTPALNTAVPSATTPLIDRYRNVSPSWYPYFKRLADMAEGIANGELIVDGAIITRVLAADAVTADILAANSITVSNAAIADATVNTLQIAGNAVTLVSSSAQTTQTSFTSSSKTSVLTLAMTTSGTQPLLAQGVITLSGATSVASPGDYSYEGLYWQNNAGDQPIEIDVTVDGQTSDPIYTTVPGSQAVVVPFAFPFSGVSSGSQTITLRAQLTPYTYSIGIRDIVLIGLETKR